MAVKVTGDFIGSLELMQERMPQIESDCLYAAARILKESARESFIKLMPSATHKSDKYSDTLADAVRFTRREGTSVKVHTLGTRDPSSGTYRARFFEGGTRKRYQKRYRGVKLAKKRFLGRIEPVNYFMTGISSAYNKAIEEMQKILNQHITNINNETL